MLKIDHTPAKAIEIYNLINKYDLKNTTVEYTKWSDIKPVGSVKIHIKNTIGSLELSDNCPFDISVSITDYGYLIVTGMGIQTALTL